MHTRRYLKNYAHLLESTILTAVGFLSFPFIVKAVYLPKNKKKYVSKVFYLNFLRGDCIIGFHFLGLQVSDFFLIFVILIKAYVQVRP